MKNKLIKIVLKDFCAQYKEKHGDSLSALSKHKYNSFSLCGRDIEKHLDPYLKDGDGGYLIWIFDELEERGHLKKFGSEYYLTIKGYAEGTRSKAQKALNYLNANPGCSIVISIVAVIVSVIALFKSGQS